jgi:type I restriction enzyme S subunit
MTMPITIGDLAQARVLQVSDGYRTRRDQLASSGYRIIRVADVQNERIRLESPDFVSVNYERQIGTRAAAAGDVLLTTKGTFGRVARVTSLPEKAVYSPQLCFFRVNDVTTVDPRWLLYWLSSEEFLRQASHHKDNTDMAAYVSLSDLRSISITLPVRKTQQAIAEVLGALDDKIAASESLMSTAYSKLAHSGHLVPLSTTASFINGKAFTKGASDTGRLVVRIAEMNSGISNSSVYSDAIVDEEYLARPGSILFAWSGSLSVHRWFREEAIVNQHIFNVLPNPGYPNWLVFQMLQSNMASFRAIAADKATTMGHIQRHHLEALVSLPAHEQLASCDALMAASWSKALLSERESLALAALRDTLLPALMSGKLRVRDAEKAVEEVL